MTRFRHVRDGTGAMHHTGRNQMGRSPPRRRRESNEEARENHYCLFCKVQLPSKKLIIEHNASAVHKQKEDLINKALADALHLCYTCERMFPTKIELDAHCLMARHQPLYRVDGLEEELGKTEEEEEEEEKVANMSEADSKRAQGNKERSDIVMKLNKMRGNEYDQRKETKKNFCDVCNVDCLNPSNYRIHLDSWRHRAEVDKKKEEEKKFEEEAEKKFQESEENERMKVPSHLRDKMEYFCEVCSVPLSGEPAYLQHMKGKKHLRQISLMKQPLRCYVCRVDYKAEKDFNQHLQSRSHMDKAFKGDGKNRLKAAKERNDDWVEKKLDKRDKNSRDKRSDDRRDSRSDRRDNRGSKDCKGDNRASRKMEPAFPSSDRKVELVTSPTDSGMVDLREKLQGSKIVVTKPTAKESPRRSERSDKPAPHQDPDKRAKELEIEVTFKKLSREYHNDLIGLKERLTRERENDISVYQQYETTYNKLCEEEDYVRENLRVLEENDPSKEEYIRDMIRIQGDMREVRQELEIREMMIIKRETLFRDKFPNSTDNTVMLNPEQKSPAAVVIDYHHGNKNVAPGQDGSEKKSDSDLRIQLERERLLKRLGPELDSVDPTLKERLLSVILDKEKATSNQSAGGGSSDQRQVVANSKQNQIKMLNEREKQLEKELAELKSTGTKKITKSLVPQYDDLEEKNKEKKQSRGRRRSVESASSRSSSSSSSDSGSRSGSKRSKRRRRGSPSKSRSRKKRKRSTSRDRRKKGSSRRGRDEDRKRRSDRKKSAPDRKKPVKMTLKAHDKGGRIVDATNPLPDDSESESQSDDGDVTEITPTTIPVIGSSASIPVLCSNAPPVRSDAINKPFASTSNVSTLPSIPPQRREQFSFWKNPAVVAAPLQKDSPKEDVWDIAFSGAKESEKEADETANLFSSSTDMQNPLPIDILNILKSVAPIMQNMQQLSQRTQVPQQPNQLQATSRPSNNTRLPGEPSTPQQGSSAGGRVRSILKKMKEAPPVAVVEDDHPAPTEPKPTPKGFSIPGLESAPTTTNETPATNARDRSAFDAQRNYPASENYGEKQSYSGDVIYSGTSARNRDTQHLNQANLQAPLRISPVGMPSAVPDYGDLRREPARGHDNDISRWGASVEPTRSRDDHIVYDGNRQQSLGLQRDRSPVAVRRAEDAYKSRGYPDDINRPNLERDYPSRLLPPVGRDDVPVGRDIAPSNVDRMLPRPRDPYVASDSRAGYCFDGDPPARVSEFDRRTDDRGPPPMLDDRPPVRNPGESEDTYYERFERYYEMKRRREQEVLRRSRLPDDDFRRGPPPRGVPPRDDPLYRTPARLEDRYDDRLRRPDDRGVLPPLEYSGRAAGGRPEPSRDGRFLDGDRRRLPDDTYRRMETERRPLEDDRRRIELPGRMPEDRRPYGRYERDPYDRTFPEKDKFPPIATDGPYVPAQGKRSFEGPATHLSPPGKADVLGTGNEANKDRSGPINRGILLERSQDMKARDLNNSSTMNEPPGQNFRGPPPPRPMDQYPQQRGDERLRVRTQYY